VNGRSWVGKNMGQGSNHSTDYIKNQIFEASQAVFDIIPKDPEIEHITANMSQTSMHEHAGEDVKYGSQRYQIGHISGDEGKLINKSLVIGSQQQLKKENQYINQDQKIGHYRGDMSRIIISQRDHEKPPFI
jgi:hypothetical protein